MLEPEAQLFGLRMGQLVEDGQRLPPGVPRGRQRTTGLVRVAEPDQRGRLVVPVVQLAVQLKGGAVGGGRSRPDSRAKLWRKAA